MRAAAARARPERVTEGVSTNPQAHTGRPPGSTFFERRRTSRIAYPFKATVYGAAPSGQPREFETVLGNISSSGLFVALPELFEEGTVLLVVSRLSKAPDGDSPAPLVALHGPVVRTEERPLDGWGHALKITCTHFL